MAGRVFATEVAIGSEGDVDGLGVRDERRRNRIALHRFLLEIDVWCIDELPQAQLGASLLNLCTAGLYGISLNVRRAEIDGATFGWEPDVLDDPAHPEEITPPHDERVIWQTRAIVREIAKLAQTVGVPVVEGVL